MRRTLNHFLSDIPEIKKDEFQFPYPTEIGNLTFVNGDNIITSRSEIIAVLKDKDEIYLVHCYQRGLSSDTEVFTPFSTIKDYKFEKEWFIEDEGGV